MKIYYQGYKGSHEDMAMRELTKKITKKVKKEDVNYYSFTTAAETINKLMNCEDEYCVLPYTTSDLGQIEEATLACSARLSRNTYPEIISTFVTSINFHLYARRPDIKPYDISNIYTSALIENECRKNLSKKANAATIKIVESEAVAAEMLANDEYNSDYSAILCSEYTAKEYNLKRIDSNFADSRNLEIEYRLFKLSKEKTEAPVKKFFNQVFFLLSNEKIMRKFTKLLFMTIMFIGLLVYAGKTNKGNAWQEAGKLFAPLGIVFLILTSDKIRQSLRFMYIKGHYKLMPIKAKNENGEDCIYDKMLTFKILSNGSDLVVKSWNASDSIPLFTSNRTSVTQLGKNTGTFYFWYINETEPANSKFTGNCELKWHNEANAEKINRLTGWMYNRLTGEITEFAMIRISKKEFKAIHNSRFLDINEKNLEIETTNFDDYSEKEKSEFIQNEEYFAKLKAERIQAKAERKLAKKEMKLKKKLEKEDKRKNSTTDSTSTPLNAENAKNNTIDASTSANEVNENSDLNIDANNISIDTNENAPSDLQNETNIESEKVNSNNNVE